MLYAVTKVNLVINNLVRKNYPCAILQLHKIAFFVIKLRLRQCKTFIAEYNKAFVNFVNIVFV